MKTLYADGKTGKVAIMDGDLDVEAVNNPVVNAHKLYFHSDFDYLYHVANVTGSVTLEYRNDSARLTEHQFATIPWNDNDIPIIFAKVNGKEVCGDVPFVKNGYNNFRILGIQMSRSTGSLSFHLRERSISMTVALAAFTAAIEVKVFTVKKPDSSVVINMQPDNVSFSYGKFKSDLKYAKLGSGYKLAQKQPYDVWIIPPYATGWEYTEPESVGIQI